MIIMDVGAKFGIHPNFKSLKNLYNFILIDSDPQEIKDLKLQYKNHKNIKCFNYFINNIDENYSNLNTYKHIGLHSYYELTNSKIIKKIKVKNKRIDSFNEKIKILKVDVEGKEVDCLIGARNQLRKNIVGVRCEILLNSIYKNQNETWSSVNKILCDEGFEFMKFEYNTSSFKSYTKYQCNDKYGKVFGADGIWTKKRSIINNSKNYKKIIDFCVFCIMNNLYDLAIDTIKKNNYKIYKEIKKDRIYKKIFYFVEKKIANLFFDLRKISANKNLIEKDYEKMFKKKFPSDGFFFKKYKL